MEKFVLFIYPITLFQVSSVYFRIDGLFNEQITEHGSPNLLMFLRHLHLTFRCFDREMLVFKLGQMRNVPKIHLKNNSDPYEPKEF